MSNSPGDFSFGKWAAGIGATIIAALLVWWLTHPGGVLDPRGPTELAPNGTALTPTLTATPTPTPKPNAPHAPAIQNTFGVELFEEQQRLIKIGAGQQVTLRGQEMWMAPPLTEVGCANGFLALTWIVREPYPGGDDLQIRALIPQGGGNTEKVASGASGSTTMGYCGELILLNTSLVDYQVEIRYASAVQ